MLTWKALRGKNHDIPLTTNYHCSTEATTSCYQSSPTSGGYNREYSLYRFLLCLSLSLTRSVSLAHTLCTVVTHSYTYINHNNNNHTLPLHNMFALSHIYSDMTIRLFTNIAPMGSQKHIYKYVPASGKRFSSGPRHLTLTCCN